MFAPFSPIFDVEFISLFLSLSLIKRRHQKHADETPPRRPKPLYWGGVLVQQNDSIQSSLAKHDDDDVAYEYQWIERVQFDHLQTPPKLWWRAAAASTTTPARPTPTAFDGDHHQRGRRVGTVPRDAFREREPIVADDDDDDEFQHTKRKDFEKDQQQHYNNRKEREKTAAKYPKGGTTTFADVERALDAKSRKAEEENDDDDDDEKI